MEPARTEMKPAMYGVEPARVRGEVVWWEVAPAGGGVDAAGCEVDAAEFEVKAAIYKRKAAELDVHAAGAESCRPDPETTRSAPR